MASSLARRLGGPLLLLVGSITVSLLAAEGILRAFFPGDAPLFMDIYRLDEAGQLGMKPGIKRRHLAREWDVTVSINGQGLRDRDVPLNASGGTVLALGDSFAFGWGVSLEDTFLYVAEESLRPQSVRIVKAGIPGTGTTDQLAWLKAHIATFAPDVVLLAFYVGNDFVDVQMGGVPGQFVVKGGLLVRRELEGGNRGVLGRAEELVLRHSLFAQRAAQVSWRISRQRASRENPGLLRGDRWLEEFSKIHEKTPPPETERGVKQTLAALSEMKGFCDARGTKLVLMAIPRSFQIYAWELPAWQKAFHISDAQLDLDRPQRLLADWARDSGVVEADCLEPFRKAAATGDRLFFYPDSHMSIAGHREVADLLVPVLRSELGANVGAATARE